jgi:hypothetical protein
MNARAAPAFGAVLVLALFGAGTCHALSLRSSAAELFLGDASPGTTVAVSTATGSELRVENSGRDPARLEFKAVSPPSGGLRDGFEPWPHPESVRVTVSRAELKPGDSAVAELAVTVPKDPALIGGQYEVDVMATGRDRAGASLTLKTRVLLSVGAPLPSAEATAGGFADRPGFALTPTSASGREAAVKFVNAGEEDLTVTLSPARDWSDDVRIPDGYEPAPNPRWLHFEAGTMRVRAGAIGRARIWADVPRESRYAGRRWAFVAAVDAVAGGRRTRRYFVLAVNTEKNLEEETRVR